MTLMDPCENFGITYYYTTGRALIQERDGDG